MSALAEKLKIMFTSHRQIGGRWVQATYVILDVFCIFVNAFLAFYIRFIPDVIGSLLRLEWPTLHPYPFFPYYAGFLVLYIALIVLLFKSYDLYRTPRGKFWGDEAISVLKGVSLATFLLMIFIYLSKMPISRFVVLASWGLNTATLAAWRYFKRKVVERRVAQGYGTRNVLIVGAGRVGQKLAGILSENRHLGFVVKGFLDDYKDGDGILGRLEDLPQVLQRHFINEVIITIPSERELVKRVASEARRHRAAVKVVPELFDGVISQARPVLELIGDLPVMAVHQEPIPELGLLIKRVMDIIGALVGILLFAPLILGITIAIKLDDRGPVIYKSKRVGKKGRVFACYKFRTMVPNADAIKEQLRHLNERQGPFFKITNDPRLTRVGRFIRKYSLDEWPQFFNVLKGDMSLVGPRPHPLDDFRQYSLEHYRRLDIKPGMTSLWAVEAQGDPSFERNMALDLYYIENWSLWLDVKILLRTISTVLKGVGR